VAEMDGDRMSREEIEALREGATPFWYGGSGQTIVSFSVQPDGMCVSLTCFSEPGESQMSTVVPWGEFAAIAADVPLMVASGDVSQVAGKSVHCGPVED
jgi:hypothetical protein